MAASTSTTKKSIDILVLGATGFTGRLVTRYLFGHPEFAANKFTFAIAARSKSKLDALAESLNISESRVKRVVVDVTDLQSVERAIKDVKVVINNVGPFFKWSTPVVKACASTGTHYVDITGETVWIHKIIRDYDYLASKTGAIVIPSCGFDSIPSDVAAYLSVRAIKQKLGPEAQVGVSKSSWALKGQVSGGTFSTAMALIEELPPQELAATWGSHSLSPVKGIPTTRFQLYYKMPFHKIRYGTVFPMAPGNKAIVERTWGLKELQSREAAYGPMFQYDEFIGTKGRITAVLTSLTFALLMASLSLFKPVRWLARKIMPIAGEGPSESSMQKGFFKTTNIASSTQVPTLHAKSVFTGQGDGYLTTSVMVAESALLLVNPTELPPIGGGIWTPMSALGDKLLERLEATGRFTCHSEILEDRKTR